MINFDKYKKLLTDFQIFEAQYWETAFAAEKEKLLVLEKDYQGLAKTLNQIAILESPAYNIFEILNVRQYEEKLHTPFLGNLLNPKGSHGQGSLFLNLFFEQVLKLDYCYEKITHFSIIEEHRSDTGRIDIICSFYVADKRVGIIIENKIYAKDQDDQLQRYYDYLMNNLALEQANRKLYYLSPHKTQPTEKSMDIETAKKLRSSGELTEIGYHADIIPWLSRCLKKIESPRIKFIVQQYIEATQRL